MRSFYKETTDQHILINIDNTSAISAMNKVGSMVSAEIDIIIRKIRDWTESANNWVTVTHTPGIFNTERNKESRIQEEQTEWMPTH